MSEKGRRKQEAQRARTYICRWLLAVGFPNPWSINDGMRAAAVSQILPFQSSGNVRDDLVRAEAALRESERTGGPAHVPAKRAEPRAKKALKAPKKPVRAPLSQPTQKQIDAFYDSWDWKRLSYRAKLKVGRKCQCCGVGPNEGAVINTDHIKPIRRFWELRLDPNNLQILCNDCNRGKGSWDETDFRGVA